MEQCKTCFGHGGITVENFNDPESFECPDCKGTGIKEKNKVVIEMTANGWHVAVTLNDVLVAEQRYTRCENGYTSPYSLDGRIPEELADTLYQLFMRQDPNYISVLDRVLKGVKR